MSKVMANGNDRIKFPINEPAVGQEEVADRRVSRVLPGPRRPAHRARDRRHHRDGDRAARPRGRVPPVPDDVLRGAAGPGGQDRRAARRARVARHPGRSRSGRLSAPDLHEAGRGPARRCSTRSSSAKARRASARETSRRCSRRSSGSRRRGATSEGRGCRDGGRDSRDGLAPAIAMPSEPVIYDGMHDADLSHAWARSRASGTSRSGGPTADCTPKS